MDYLAIVSSQTGRTATTTITKKETITRPQTPRVAHVGEPTKIPTC